jgi:hypothetical protein
MNLQENIRRILKEETDSVKNLNESKTSQHLKIINNLLEPFKEKDCICDIRVTFDVEENYYDIYLVFSQKELHEKFFDLYVIRSYIQEMMNEVKMELESFLPIRNVFIGNYTNPNCEWSPLNESENKKSGLLRAIEEDGLFQVIQDTGLSLPQIYTKTGELPREVYERYIKDFIKQEGYPGWINGTLVLIFTVEIQKNIQIEHFYLEGDKVTVEISGYNDYGEQTDGYIESLSNLTDDEIFTIVENMINWFTSSEM